jgi:2-methylisocitrate lyase-like PEP mutase family enzyme
LVGHRDAFRESVRRLQAYAEAGADVLFAPGVHKPEEIKALVEAVRPKPFNLLVISDTGLGVSDFAALGVRRISVGGALALTAWGSFMRAAQALKSDGSFSGFTGLAPYGEVNNFLAAEFRTRGM